MRTNIKFLFILTFVLILFGCKNEENDPVSVKDSTSNQNQKPDEIKEFIWKAMNQYYYWYKNVPQLSDDRFATELDFIEFSNQYNSPDNFFNSLLYKAGTVDRFSWIQDDYEELGAGFQGISESFGYEFGLGRISDGNDLFGFVKYVVPGSPAAKVGLKRGDIFTEINGNQLNVNNYKKLVYGLTEQKLSLSKAVGKSFISRDTAVSMIAVELQENPILLNKVLEIEGTKIGYLCYNQFISNETANKELNDVFGKFKNEGITEMVLDLRYNGGGYVLSAQLLGSMLYNGSSKDKVFAKIVYNDKRAAQGWNQDINFYSSLPNLQTGEPTSATINKINISRLFVLTDKGTASASELIIAGMKPFMEVITIGQQTYGKNVGSITLYDSPSKGYLSKEGVNPNHKYALQPIVSQLANSADFTDYTNGFEPTVPSNEVENLATMKELGDPEEQYLAEAIAIITDQVRPARAGSALKVESVFNSEIDMKKQNALLEGFMLSK